jgi:hypothetical protein
LAAYRNHQKRTDDCARDFASGCAGFLLQNSPAEAPKDDSRRLYSRVRAKPGAPGNNGGGPPIGSERIALNASGPTTCGNNFPSATFPNSGSPVA